MKINKLLFKKRYDGERNFIPLSDIPVEFLVPENNIMIHVEAGYNDSNGWNEGITTLTVSIYREQTDEEKAKMKNHFEELRAKSKLERREQYLKLKKEFENEQ
jgi:hypothetical protein